MSSQQNETHVKIVAWLHIVLSVLGVLAALFVFVLFVGIGLLAAAADETEAMGLFAVLGIAISAFLLLLAAPGLVGGIGLLKRQNWARILVLILSVLQLLNVPIGTVIGVYSLWALTREETIALFGETRGWNE